MSDEEEDDDVGEEFYSTNDIGPGLADISGISDSEDEEEIYDPMPYAFILKDANRNRLALPPERAHNSVISCPPLHVLVDHVLAVLWCYYSQKGHDKLGTAQLHWAIKFLEGLRDRHVYSNNRQTEDVRMAIDHLEEALIERGAAANEEEIQNRKYDDEKESTRIMPLKSNMGGSSKSAEYDDFVKDLMGPGKKNTSEQKDGEEGEEGEGQEGKEGPIVDASLPARSRYPIPSIHIESPSIIINDMLSDDPDTMVELLETTINNMEGNKDCTATVPSQGTTLSLTNNVADVKNNLIQRIINDLENLKAIDETLRDLKCDSNPLIAVKLKDIIDMVGKQ